MCLNHICDYSHDYLVHVLCLVFIYVLYKLKISLYENYEFVCLNIITCFNHICDYSCI